ncbi:MAG: two-component system, cell cycle response regulator DivK [Sphingomonadales bacterium]|nr:two-component system, cell cycle response regulator DivK [Sphingomonadales bacterium]
MGQKILVVEDNELNLKLFCDLLRAHGYEAEPVRDGREAVDRARGFAPDLIVMDIQMPYVSGLELIEQIKGDAELRRTPIMAVTAYAAKGDEERIRAAGAEGYVSKPISVVRFVEAVRGLLAAPRADDEAMDEVRVTRRIAAAPEAVFDAWLDPKTAGRWLFATPEGEMVRVEIDPRVGGRYEIVEARDGEVVLHTGSYEEIERPRRLAFLLQVPKYAQNSDRIGVDIVPTEGGSELTLTQSLSPGAPASREQIERGWGKVLAALAMQVERQGDET